MNADKVLALAKEAGFIMSPEEDAAYSADVYDGLCTPELIKFAALIQQQMEVENAGLRKDAARYQFLRDNPDFQIEYTGDLTLDEHVDAAIDQARNAND